MTADTELVVPQGSFELKRSAHPVSSNLRAWDAADEYVLAHLADQPLGPGDSILVLNDGFGALGCALSPWSPMSMSDSVLAREATQANLAANELGVESVRHLRSTDFPTVPVDVLIVKIPRSLAFLEDQLHRVRPVVHARTLVVGAGMTKTVHNSTIELFTRLVGPTSTSKARKKARLLFSTVEEGLGPLTSPFPSRYRLSSGEEVVCHANVFSQGRLDQGTALLLDHLPSDVGAGHIVDLGCGSGALGLRAAALNPQAQVSFADSSYMAVASAKETWQASFGSARPAHFSVADTLTTFADASADLVVNNPPFHADRSMGDAIAWRMFHESHRCLKPTGALLVVGNRHLGYHTKLKRVFGNCVTLASNPKFVVLRATKAFAHERHSRGQRDRAPASPN